jgi:Undecaprenyl-phosphate galactose phosphotransferase WbaP
MAISEEIGAIGVPVEASVAEALPGSEAESLAPAAKPLTATGWARVGRVLLLMANDIAVLVASSGLALWVWAFRVHHQPLSLYLELWPLIGFFILGFAKAGLYPGFGLGAVETLRKICLRTSFIFLLIAAASFAMKVPHQYSRMTFVIAWASSVVLLPVTRFALLSLVSKLDWWGESALIVGTGDLARRCVLALKEALSLGYKPRWALSLDAEPPGKRVRIALITVEDTDAWTELVRHLEHYFRNVVVIRPGIELPVESAHVRNLGGVLGIDFRNQLLLKRNRIIKKVLDVVISGAGLLISLPIIAVCALLIKLSSRGPVFYSQEREGLGGRDIRVRKLRTMYLDAEQRLEEHLEANAAARAEWERCFKLSDDPRLIPGGKVLRRFSLDELPQLWSVLKGDMSLVGPRPFPHYHLETFDSEFRDLRRRVRPGLTGLWQVMVRSEGGVEEQKAYDTHYIRNWSVWLDLYIIGKTTGAVLLGRGAY